jgi:DNA helicase-2/ATP-dependent DNA helicase PcrA
MEELLLQFQIPYQMIGGMKFYERAEVRDLLGYLRLIVNPYDSVSLKRVVNTPTRGIGNTTIAALEAHSIDQAISLWDAAKDLCVSATLRPAARTALHGFITMIEQFQSKLATMHVSALVEMVLEQSTLRKYYEDQKSIEAESKLENLREFLTAVQRFEARSEDVSLRAFLEETALIADVDTVNSTGRLRRHSLSRRRSSNFQHKRNSKLIKLLDYSKILVLAWPDQQVLPPKTMEKPHQRQI